MIGLFVGMLGKLRRPRRASLERLPQVVAVKHRSTPRGVGMARHFLGVEPPSTFRAMYVIIKPPDGLLDSHFVVALGGRFAHPAISELPKVDAALTLYIVFSRCHCSFIILPPRVMQNGV